MAEHATALVTGASSGIGTAIARVLAERGYNLVLTARRKERLEASKNELERTHGIRVHLVALDLATREGADLLYERIQGREEPLAVLVNNAGIGVYGNALDLDYEQVRRMLELNVMALTTLTHRVARDMRDAGRGRILQIASIGAFQPSPLYAVYAATKAYVLQMSCAMNYELQGTGVTITTVNPGLTESEFHERADHLKPASMDWMFMSARDVAVASVNAMEAGRPVCTPGVLNKLMAAGVKLASRSFSTRVAERIMRNRR